jgi:hypothetical protein
LSLASQIADHLYSFTDVLLNPGAYAGIAELPSGKKAYYYNRT